MHNFIIKERFMVLRLIRILLLTNISVAEATAVVFQEFKVCVTRWLSTFICAESPKLFCSGWRELR